MLNIFYISSHKLLIFRVMEESGFEDIRFEKIPIEFYSDSDKEPFCKCTFCSTDLKEGTTSYMIEKSIKKGANNIKNTVFEYAICMSCNLKKMQAMSEESVQNIKAYMEQNFVLETWESNLSSKREYFSHCVVTGKSIEELEEYNIVGQFVGDKMIAGQFPILISPSIGEEIQELLSQKTKDEFDDFMSTITDVPPELKELFKVKRPVLV